MHSPFHDPPPEPRRRPGPIIPRRLAMAAITTVTALLLLVRFDPGTRPAGQTTSNTIDPAAAGDSTGTTGSADTGSADTGSADTGSADTGSRGTTDPTPSASATSGESASTSVTGDAVQIRFGTVQVSITVSGGQLIDVTAVQLPWGGRDGQISSYAEPILRSEALQAGSANIDTVSGATYTSMGYIQSLQSALDAAGI